MPRCCQTSDSALLIKDIDWCDAPTCKVPYMHTICKWGLKCMPERRCETDVGFTKTIKDHLMELHNKKRSEIALGEDQRVPEGARGAANMRVMQWDIHLEYVARCHSRQCDPDHDQCREIPRFPKSGQNIFTLDADFEVDLREVVDKAVEEWYGEVRHIPEDVYQEYRYADYDSPDRFTQMVWANTGWMGCGLSHMTRHDGTFKYFLVCNYGVSGNIEGEPIYKVGEACSECPNNKRCNQRYKGLCGDVMDEPLKCPCEDQQEEQGATATPQG
ncbi:scoloptoxin SSD552-like isoform X2 [Anthonomus grandis grandis]|uniref:scoloptoxin SSD552-like isoform X2 n=1 Tax=Anthonomus grandis grandis TaxID=2921223 RepID=UPI002165FFF0|nr:scoloptoxin SSD552-like isoform X2 [Anthonomus grandis grandis]